MFSLRDMYYAWRSWVASLKSQGSTVPVILILALGIGATTAIFGLVDGLLRVLPFAHPERLVMLWESRTDGGPKNLRVSYPDFLDWVAQNQSFAQLAVFRPEFHNLLTADGVQRIRTPQVGSGFFKVFGVQMKSGRDFTPEDAIRGEAVLLMSERLWRSSFPSWSDPVGKTLRVDGEARRVIGVVPSGDGFPPTADLWLPFVPTMHYGMRSGHALQVAGRLRAGVSLEQAQAEMQRIAARLAVQYPDSNVNWTADVEPLQDDLIGDVKPVMWTLIGATSALLLMACVSVASVLLARGASRGPEIAMRKVLGATRGRIIFQLLVENAISAFAAAILGLIFARLILRFLAGVAPARLPQIQALSIDLRAVAFAVTVAGLTTLLFGLVPALHATRGKLMMSIRDGALSRTFGGSPSVRRGLIILENTIAFTLLVASTLLLNSLIRLTDVASGFDPKGALSVDLNLSSQRYSNPEQIIAFYDALLERLRGLPGVKEVGAVDALPMTGSSEGRPYFLAGAPPVKTGEEPIARASTSTPGYLKALGIPLLRGRDFTPADGQDAHVVLINQTMAKKGWPGCDPIGSHLGLGQSTGDAKWRVIGIVSDTKDDGLGAVVQPRIYLSQREFGEKQMTVVVRASGDPGALVTAVRSEVKALDPELPVYNVTTVEDVVRNSVARNRTVVSVVGSFSIMALLLAAVGIYGVMLANLVRRTKEFGIRIAVGSGLGQVAWIVLREGLLLVLAGIVVGLFVCFGTVQVLGSLLYGIGETDLPSYLTAAGVLMMVALAGCLLMLRKITRLDPVRALRYD
jgi:putative ABC transport system permease protein